MGAEKRLATLLLLTVLVLTACASGPGAPGTSFSVAGTITDATSAAAISGATVTVSSGSTVLGSASTNASGGYTISNVSTSATTVTWAVAATTYRSFNTPLSVSGGGSFTVNYAMAREVGAVSGTIAAAATSVRRIGPARPVRTQVRTTRGLPVYVPDRLAVKFRPNVQVSAVQALHQTTGARLHKTIAPLNVQVVRLNPGVTVLSALAAYRNSPLVEYAEQDVYAYTSATPNDSLYFLHWHYTGINLPTAWDTTTGSASVIVAVVDTGIRSHTDLNGITVQGRDTFSDDNDPTDPGCVADPNDLSHGMHVSGTIAAVTNNAFGVAGVNWGGAAGTKIMAIRALGELAGQCGAGTMTDVSDGITYAADHGAKVINLSLGSPVGTVTLESAVNYAHSRGVTLAAAAGNSNAPNAEFPAAYTNVIAVAATACDNTKASYSNFGPEVDVAAPGGDAAVTCGGDPNTRAVWGPSWSPNTDNVDAVGFVGTSSAAPHVAGLVALMISRGITGPATIQSTLQSTATDLGAPGRDDIFGHGKVNAASAVGGGAAASRLRAFWGNLVGSALTIRSDIIQVPASGSFTITNAHAGSRTVFAWQDYNGDGVLNTGDYFGQTNSVVTDGGTTTGVAVTVSNYTGAPVTVSSVLSITRTR